ncbi:class I SAM-dependent methyltransferase [Marinobacterium sp. AK62]|uniref:Class I SAM-dependent methyltransferase n=1 Tax=Marinobacterium alkalitolerans TaxID=1542925 RepID=A0ABS3ZE94_9GAMM|nr:class I SAM-dependent methyltransferase [Marinobacterium alkalitolerans]MBP0050022.1 class I SAM-dependent methyltransferase [Marinobacterium alkalitolerans]
MQAVIDWAEKQLEAAAGDARRLFHGRGSCFPGYEWLVVDWLPPVVVIRAYHPETPAAVEPLLEWLRARPEVEAVVWQPRSRQDSFGLQLLWGQLPEKHAVTEAGLRYGVDAMAKQNAGLFLDMRPGRAWVREHAEGRRVLNLFAYTCAFSIAAMAGGARSVVNVDMSSKSLTRGRDNHRLNDQDVSAVRFLAVNLLRSWGKLRKMGPYDLVVVDPPSFQPGSFVAEKDYARVLKRLPELTTAGGYVLLCHNDPAASEAFIESQVQALLPEFALKQRLSAGEDFPDKDPSGALKLFVYQRQE